MEAQRREAMRSERNAASLSKKPDVEAEASQVPEESQVLEESQTATP